MESNFSQAWVLLGIGMITIFFILSLVVISGNFLIRMVNRYAPEAKPSTPFTSSNKGISPEKVAVIVSAVDILTSGQGKVSRIDKH